MWVLYSTRCVLLVLAALLMTNAAEATEKQPNIIYILADDLGYGDLGCYGQELIKTPNIDSLAKTGMRFTDHYSGAPVCAPARCVLLTGLHTGHCPIRGNRALEFEGNVPIPKSYVTLGEVMQKAGYATGAFGKWGQGYPGSVGDPVLRGFDQFYGYNCQREAHDYYPGHLWKNDKKVVLTGNKKGKKEQYSHDLITEQALSFIATPRDKPFFVYVPYTIPHTSFQVPDLELYREKSWSVNQKTQAAMISRMDRDVGRIVKQVQALGELENTLIIFSSDNGPHGAGKTLTHFNAAGPLRGKKGATYEGGIRVPLVVSWPGKIKPGTESDLISGFQDLFPTFAELAGAKAPANIDGLSFVSELLGRPAQKKHEYLYWELGTRQGLRKGNWKAVRNSTKKKLGDVEIYDLSNDIGESNNLATQKPEIAAQFLELLQSARKPCELFPIPVLDNEK